MKRIACAALIVLTAGCDGDAQLALPVVVEPEQSPFVYPERLWDENIEGQAVVMVHVTTEGAVDSVYIRNPSGYEELDSAALAGARTLRFRPGRRGEDPVEVWVRLPVRFSKSPPEAGESDATPPRGTGTRG